MKKIIFLLATILSFTACSSDNDDITSSNKNEKTYAVNFKANVPVFMVEDSPLRAKENMPFILTHIVIYKENGEVYYNKFTSDDEYDKNPTLIDKNGAINLSLYLPLGKYHITFLAHKRDPKHPNSLTSLLPYKNFNTDYYNGDFNEKDKENNYPKEQVNNGGVYFQNAELTIVNSNETQNVTMELQPMWSYIDLTIEDAQTFKAPEGTDALEFVAAPFYIGFGVKSKLATLPYPTENKPMIVSLESIRTNSTFKYRATVSQTESANNNIGFKIKYLKKEGSKYTVLDTRELKVPQTSLENGYYYSIKGKLSNSNNLGSISMNISLGSFNKEEIIVPF